MNVWRLHTKPGGGLPLSDLDRNERFKYCLDKKVLGVGWQIDADLPAGSPWQEYYDLALK